jgi:hypothetical protein
MNATTLRLCLVCVLLGCGGGTTSGATPDAQAGGDGSTSSDAATSEGAADVSNGGDSGGAPDSGTGIVDAAPGDGAPGAPCTGDNQCTGALCLGGAFTGGYCSSPVTECDPGGGACGTTGQCTKAGGVDVDGAAVQEFCLVACSGAGGCRQGYSCCFGATYAQMADAMVCVPPSMCPDQ